MQYNYFSFPNFYMVSKATIYHLWLRFSKELFLQGGGWLSLTHLYVDFSLPFFKILVLFENENLRKLVVNIN